jgi:UDP-glucose 4-epimerase
MKTYLITGGAGFIGSALTRRLINEGTRVLVVDDLSSGKKENVPTAADLHILSLENPLLAELIKSAKPDAIFHLAAHINVRNSLKNPLEDAKTNILGSINLFEACRKNQIKTIIFPSTSGALYGEAGIIPTPETEPLSPMSPYGAAKISVENYLYYYANLYGINAHILRLANVYGPFQGREGEAGVVSEFCNARKTGKTAIIYGDGNQTRDFIYVDDVVNAFVKVLEKRGYNLYNIGTGIETSINALWDIIFQDTKTKKCYAEAQKGDVYRSALNCGKAQRELGWKPNHSLSKGIEQTYKWYVQNSHLRGT